MFRSLEHIISNHLPFFILKKKNIFYRSPEVQDEQKQLVILRFMGRKMKTYARIDWSYSQERKHVACDGKIEDEPQMKLAVVGKLKRSVGN